MYLLDQKAEDILSKIAFAEQTIKEIKSPDETLKSYIKPIESWLNTLRRRVEQSKATFAEFVHNSSFDQYGYLKDKSHKRLLAAILRDFEDIEKRVFIGVDAFLPLVFIWNSQKSTKETRQHHELLLNFVKDFLQLSHMPDSIMTIIGERYACLPVEWEKTRKHIIFGTYSETQNLRKLVLLAHEIGHVYYYQNNLEINQNVSPQVIRKLNQNKPLDFDENVFDQIVYTWTQHWIPELVSDCFAAKTLGPAFVSQFMLAALNSQPDKIESEHPPTNVRVNFMLDILEALDLADIDINNYRNLWESYAHTVSTPTSRFIVDEEVVDAALKAVDSISAKAPIEDKWSDILEAKKALSNGIIPGQDLISVISALAIEEKRIDLEPVHVELLKRYSSNSDVF